MDYKEREDWQIWAANIANLSHPCLHIPYFLIILIGMHGTMLNETGLETLAYTMEFEEKIVSL